jgi:hypothetical protein
LSRYTLTRFARLTLALALALALTLAWSACEKDPGVEGKLAAARKADDEAEAATVAAAKAVEAKKVAALEKASADRNAAQKKVAAMAAPGNRETTESMATDDESKAIIEELHKNDTFKGVAARVKDKEEQFKPLFLKALRHENSNVRTQAARILVMREWKGEDTTAAWKEALLAEADEIVRENWGYDLRLYKEPALMPAALTAFKRCKTPGALGNLGETLTELGYKEALPEIQKVLAETKDTMTRVFLLSALKRLPDESSRALAVKMLNDEKELVRTKAKQVLSVLPGPEEPAETK